MAKNNDRTLLNEKLPDFVTDPVDPNAQMADKPAQAARG